MSHPVERKRRHWGRRAAAALASVLLAVAASALSNRFLPAGPTRSDRLDPLDTARLNETLYLKHELGERIWPGWGDDPAPIMLWNEQYTFLIDMDDAPSEWERIADPAVPGGSYYRRPTSDPQNFAVRVGDRYAASMATKWETDRFLIDQFRRIMPAPLKPIFPYRLLIQPSEVQITGVLHESFHAYQARSAPARFADAERAYRDATRYWAADEPMRAAWSNESALLAQAARADSDVQAAALARRFLATRDERRRAAGLDTALIAYERRFEWLEGTAKYIELASWRAAATTPAYTPLPALDADPDFHRYNGVERRWAQELDQLRRQAQQPGEVRFYQSGMAQAALLDRLMPEWKARAFGEGVWLETLLREAADAPGR